MKSRLFIYLYFLVLLSFAGLSACSLVTVHQNLLSSNASPENEYATTGGQPPAMRNEYFRQKYGQEWNFARKELGIPKNAPLTPDQSKAITTRVELNRLENAIQTDEARKQYYALKPYFENDAQRIHFLELPTMQAREQWAREQGITTNPKISQTAATIIKDNNIALGMTGNEVEQSWGEPTDIEYAGNPVYQNERWSYTKEISTKSGYQKETRVVYFEFGRVAGWQTL